MLTIKEEKIKQICIDSDASILATLKQMDQVDSKLLIVIEKNKFFGLISIGDLQRQIIKNSSVQSRIRDILRKDIVVAYENEDIKIVKNKMFEERAEFMPVLNKKKELSDVLFWNDLFGSKQIIKKAIIRAPVIIMAGGKGSRLKPITNIFPKSLIPIGNKSIIEHIMDRFIDVGCNAFFLSVNYKHKMIKEYFNTLNNPDYQIEYFHEGKPLGTIGSLYLLKNVIHNTFFVSNCDIIIDDDYTEMYRYHLENQNEITIIAALKHFPIPYGTVETGDNGLLIKLQEKPELTYKINTGMYILEPHILDEIPNNQFFHITELIDKVKTKGGKIGVFPVSEKSWTDIGNWEVYLDIIRDK
jgi:dTDP-glucose pyrophosphorylase/predicted transcriptional regulator